MWLVPNRFGSELVWSWTGWVLNRFCSASVWFWISFVLNEVGSETVRFWIGVVLNRLTLQDGRTIPKKCQLSLRTSKKAGRTTLWKVAHTNYENTLIGLSSNFEPEWTGTHVLDARHTFRSHFYTEKNSGKSKTANNLMVILRAVNFLKKTS